MSKITSSENRTKYNDIFAFYIRYKLLISTYTNGT